MKKPSASWFSSVFALSPLYSKSCAPIRIHTMPGSPGPHALAVSSSTIFSSEIGQTLPTVPGYFSQSSGVAVVPPPSVAP